MTSVPAAASHALASVSSSPSLWPDAVIDVSDGCAVARAERRRMLVLAPGGWPSAERAG